MKKYCVYTNIIVRVEAENEAAALRMAMAQLDELPVTSISVNEDYSAELKAECVAMPALR